MYLINTIYVHTYVRMYICMYICSVIYWLIPCPYVSEQFRRKVFNSLHSLSCPSIRGTQYLITAHFVWRGINADVCQWTRNCLQCQKSKVHRHTITSPGTFSTPNTRFDNIHIGIVGPLPLSKGYGYLLTCIDHLTHWPEAFPSPISQQNQSHKHL